ncbi:hypothetical protein PR202_gb08224 [Eleusine coracana subsp. coracana]|uniref:Carbohydrate kinase PfkB domain-containing protein n=1 Tax=Eleusine coracana subsp. coracana TaxID=191504 RepID=A0AAV5EE47_ELECO|nr:hypothetical protein PR202_gb08224 [Eleusine coracana subsp. coracana]
MTLVRFSPPPASALSSAASRSAAASSSAPPARHAGSRPPSPRATASWCVLSPPRTDGRCDPRAAVCLGCGLLTLDYLATVDAYPRPDDKIRTGGLQISGGGNAGNALTGAARLGLNTRLISKVI